MEFIYSTKGTCSRQIKIEYDEHNIVQNVMFVGGCPGNTQGVAKLCVGKSLNEIITILKGIKCGFKPTSCPDQLALACETILINKEEK